MRTTLSIVFCLFYLILLTSCDVKTPTLNENNLSDSLKINQEFATLNLMPVPASLKRIDGNYRITQSFSLDISENADSRLFNAANNFLRRLDGRTGFFFTQGMISKEYPQTVDNPQLIIDIQRIGDVKLYEDESYKLTVSKDIITLNAITDIGALRGLETLLQLLDADENGYFFPCIEIKDAPRFPWRGLMIDAARHFQPVDVIKRNLDAMAAVKMNVLHFHLCDNHGWRVESKTYPKLHELASDGQYYSQVQLKEIVQYAADRGIRVMPEFDVPGHATAILVAYPELGSAPGPYTLERNAGIFNPVLDPTNEKTYEFLDNIIREMALIFPDPYFHIGGDENNGKDWKSNKKIKSFMDKNNFESTLDLQTYFNNRLIKSIKKQNKKMMGWEEILTDELSKEAVIHSWLGKKSLFKAASKGYQTLLSNGYYIDLLFPASDHYKADPLPSIENWTEEEKKYPLSPEQEKLILGGEATMWSEIVSPMTIDSRIWPRTAAIAERLWSPRNINDVEDMYRRLDVISFRLEELGLTHIKNRDVILRNLANGQDITPLKVLVEVLEPYKEYYRNGKIRMYKTYSPLTLMADATSADARGARIFNTTVNRYVSKPEKNDLIEIKNWLSLWQSNHAPFMALTNRSPVLKQLENTSATLEKLAILGLEITSKSTSSASYYNEKTNFINEIKKDIVTKMNSDTKEDGRCEIMIVDAIQLLLDMTNREMAKERIEKEALALENAIVPKDNH